MTTQDSRLMVIYRYFGKAPANEFRGDAGTLTTFREEWKDLTEKDKDALHDGIKNGTLTY